MSAPLADLVRALGDLESRAQEEDELARYRIVGEGVNGTEGIPDGWHTSRAMERLASEGGWWPGNFAYPVDQTDMVSEIVTVDGLPRHIEPTIRWAHVGSVWERDHFYTPLLPYQVESAPLFGFSNQALWTCVVFPSEAALLESFAVAYDEIGLDEFGSIDPFFVEWITAPPLVGTIENPENEAKFRVHERLVQMSSQGETDHPCWLPTRMPFLHDQRLPIDIIGALLGIDADVLGAVRNP